MYMSAASLARLSPDLRTAVEQSALEAAERQRARGPVEDAAATEKLKGLGMTIHDLDRSAFLPAAEKLWQAQAQELGAQAWLAAIRG